MGKTRVISKGYRHGTRDKCLVRNIPVGDPCRLYAREAVRRLSSQCCMTAEAENHVTL